MRNYVMRQVILIAPTLLFISLIVFLAIHLLPGSPRDQALQRYADLFGVSIPDRLRAEVLAAYGFDRPFPERYADWAGGLLRGDLGYSIPFDRSVAAVVKPHLPRTGERVAAALAVVPT